jgi:deazaflavin-dependent oxidoreductase (nitroreductase family)
MPSNALMRAANQAHRLLQQATGGRLGWSARGMPVLEVTTIGRRSGEPRTVLLTAPIHDDHGYVVVGSAGGNDGHPAWFLNVQANPAVRVRHRRAVEAMVAHVASPEERADWWARILEAHPHYGGYQAKTDREIPLVRFSPP